VINTKTKDLKW